MDSGDKPSLKGKRILLIEDEELIRGLFLDEIGDYDAEVIPCESAKEGLAKSSSIEFDAIITDIRMPGISGLEFLEQFKEHKHNAGIPVIVMTGSINLTVEDLVAKGATKVFFKPVQLQEFMKYLVDVLS